MNRQSDYGYAVSSNEYRSPELCLRRAALCDQLAANYPNDPRYPQWATGWREEAKTAK